MQVKELAPCVRHAADFGDVQLKAGLVPREVIANQLAAPRAKEVTRMFASTAGTEVLCQRLAQEADLAKCFCRAIGASGRPVRLGHMLGSEARFELGRQEK